MADDITLPAQGTGTSTPIVATDEVGSAHYQRMKLDAGGAGVSVPVVAGQQAMAASVPVVIASDQTSVPVSGTLTAVTAVTAITNALPAGNNNIGDVDVASVTGNVTVVQGTGTNLHAVIDSGTITAVTALTNALPAGDNNIGNVDVVTLPNVTIGTMAALVAGNANIGDVDVASVTGNVTVVQGTGTNLHTVVDSGTLTTVSTVTAVTSITNPVTVSSHAVTNAGVFATQVDGAALTALQLIDDTVKVDDAAFTVAVSSVSMAGALAVAMGSAPDDADAGDAVVTLANRNRVQFTIGGHPNVLTLKHTTITTAVADAAIITISTGSKICVTRLTATLDNASTVFPTVLIGFGTASTPTTTGVLAAHGGVPAGGGFTIGDGSGIIGCGADNEDLRVTTTGNATGNGLQITVTYFTVPS